MTFGEALRRYRKKRGWTQTQLAHILEVSDSIVSEWERNEKVPQQRLILKKLRTTLSEEIPEVRKLTGVRLREAVEEKEDPLAGLYWRATMLADEFPDRVCIETTEKERVIKIKVR